MTQDRILDRIKKTLALASNNPSQEEAQAAMLKAQELLAKHGLSMADVQSAQQVETPNVADEMAGTGTTWWEKELSAIIGQNFRCTHYFVPRVGIFFIGLEEDVAIAREIFTYAKESIRTSWKRYRRQEKRKNGLKGELLKGVMNDYITGFLKGLADKFKEQVDRNKWGLVLVKDDLVVQATQAKGLRIVRSKGVRSRGDSAARQAGYREGRNFSDGGPGGTKQIEG